MEIDLRLEGEEKQKIWREWFKGLIDAEEKEELDDNEFKNMGFDD